MIESIKFLNYKAFRSGEIKIKPITLLLGKNSSGKSAICKLFPLLSQALTKQITVPFMLDNNGIVLGGKYTDIFHNQQTSGLSFEIENDKRDYVLCDFFIKDGNLSIFSNIWGNRLSDYRKEYYFGNNEKCFGMLCNACRKDGRIDIKRFNFSSDYLSPVRSSIGYAVRYKGVGRYPRISPGGENAYDLLINSYLNNTPLYSKVSHWMEKNLDGQKLIIKRLTEESDLFGFFIARGQATIPIVDVGQGVSQLLPILVQSYNSHSADITIFEQPALHLHPAAHEMVIERLVQSVKVFRRKYIIETHSENILLGLRRLVSDPQNSLRPEDVIVYYVDNESGIANLEEITINENGELSTWPTGVFSEGFEILTSILKNKQ